MEADTGLVGNNLTQSTESPNCTTVIHPYSYIIEEMNRYTSLVSFSLGFPGNIFAFLVWIRPSMRHSSGIYMAILAATQFTFLACKVILYLQLNWKVFLLNYPVVCELFPVIFYTVQYLDPSLYLAFTVERYISVCYPFKRSELCTTKRAVYVSIGLAFLSMASSSIQAYFYTYDDLYGCTSRDEVLSGGQGSVWNVWSYFSETLYFLLVPVTVLVLNICVIRALIHSRSRFNIQNSSNVKVGGRDKTAANSRLLLFVSFYFILCLLPVSIIYVIYFLFPAGEPCMVQEEDPTWNGLFLYELIRTVIESTAVLHFALNFYIYIIIGKVFRDEFCRMMSCFKVKRAKPRPEIAHIYAENDTGLSD